MLKHYTARTAVGSATLAIVLLSAGGPTAAVRAAAPQLESALRLDVEVLGLRRCYRDLSITTDQVDARLIFTNVSSRPIAVVRNQRGVVYRMRLEPDGVAVQGEPPPNVVIHYGHKGPHQGYPGRPETDGFAVLLPKDALALVTTLSLRVHRPGTGEGPALLRRLRYTMSVTSQLRVAEYESEEQPLSSARSLTLDSHPVPLDLSASLPLEFCESSDASSR